MTEGIEGKTKQEYKIYKKTITDIKKKLTEMQF